MKKVCDHCGGGTEKAREDQFIVWCKQCVFDDNALFKAAGLTTIGGTPWSVPPLSGEICVAMSHNIEKLKAIPPKGAKSSVPTMGANVQVIDFKSEPIATIEQEPAFDFDKYNSTVPGRQYGYR